VSDATYTGPTAICLPAALLGRVPPGVAQFSVFLERAANAYGLDVFILAAIMWRESLGGAALTPPGPGGKGDCEQGVWYGFGLMQIDSRSHADFIRQTLGDGTPAWADPESNITEGACILRDAYDQLGSDYPAAVCAYNAGVGRARRALSTLPADVSTDRRIACLDAVTTGGDYVTAVLAHRDAWLKVDPTQGAPT
jgi:soluble lytic murein transglycosylase-like protein